MKMRERLISAALKERFDELRGELVTRLAPETFAEAASFVAEVRELLRAAEPIDLKTSATPSAWAEADADCLTSLRALALGQMLPLRPAPEPSPVDAFVNALQSSRNDHEQRFRLLTQRYSWPLNFSLTTEDAAREYVLARLMARDRARVEKDGIGAVNSDDLLLRLNLCALYASRASDLRFLDALNYYYELLPAAWRPGGRNSWLLASYLALYARALATWVDVSSR